MGLSPMMTHYLQVKENYKDCVLFYRLGDFYEMFFDDAIKVSSLLELTLTGRDCGLEERAPMCGIPFHAAETYIAKLVSLGEKVAICEQLTAPTKGEIVKRDVIKVVTAGTLTNSELIDEKSNNFIACAYYFQERLSLAWADITTGEFFTRDFDGEKAIFEFLDVLVRISPAEIIANDLACQTFNEFPLIKHGVLPRFSYFIESEFNYLSAKESIINQFNVKNLSIYGIEDKNECICSCGALISYLNQTQKHALKNISSVKLETPNDIMMLDTNAIKNLELVSTLREGKRYGSLLWLLDKTKTSMGARKLKNWILSPLNSIESINYRLDGVESFYKNTLIRQSLTDILSQVKDIARITGKISNGNLNPRDCVSLRNSLEVLPSIKFQLMGENAQILNDINENILDFSDISKTLFNAICDEPPVSLKDGGFIKKGYSLELDELLKLSKSSKSLIAEIENRERERTGIKNLKIGYNRVFGYYIEITNSYKHLTPYDYNRRQTLANAERFTTEELKDLEIKILSSEEKSISLENELFNQIKDMLLARMEDLKNLSDALATLDVLLALSNVARQNGYTKPEILSSENALNIVDGRHPVIEQISNQKFVPNDCLLDSLENRTMIITGPNMAGKSTYMRQVALITLMAHIGSFVPAKSASIPITDKIFTRIGASDNLILDQSTFMVEMSEMAGILTGATKNSLLIIDEIGRGTSTFDGLSIAWSVLEYLTKNLKAKTLFATHYHELTELEGVLEGVKNYKITVKEMANTIVFLRKIMRGGTNRSFGIEVAQLAGINKEVIDRAKQILKTLEKSNLTTPMETCESNSETKSLTDVERIVLDLDLNNLSPMQALNVLIDLQEKVKEN